MDNDKKAYQKAKNKCRLDSHELRMAIELGISAEKLLSMIPHRNEPWKDPVALRIRRLYDKVRITQGEMSDGNRDE